MHTTKHVALAIAVGLFTTLTAAAEPSLAESWPQRPVRFMTPFPSGSTIDFAARLYADRLAARWGKPVIVENRPGGDGIIGVAAFVGQRDDHTLLFTGSTTFTINPVISDKLPYDAARDLVPISSTSEVFIPVTVSASLDIGSLAELVAHARAQPGKLNWAAGPGLPQYVFGAFVKSSALDMVPVSYRELGPALQDLREGRLHVIVQGLTAVLPQVQAGKARMLAIANRHRPPLTPDVPTVIEAGYPELVMDSGSGLFGFRDMPGELRDRIAADVRAVAADPDVQARLAQVGQLARAGTPAEFTSFLEQARARIVAIVAVVGTKPTW